MHFPLHLKSKPLTNTLLLKSLTTSTLPQTPSSHIFNNQSNPNFFSYKTLFFHLKSTSNLQETRKLHSLLIAHGHLHKNFSPVLGSQLVHTYISLHSLQEAILVFHQLLVKNSFAWNSILKGLVDVGLFSDAIDCYHQMMSERIMADNFTYPLVLRACSGLFDVKQGRIVEKSIELDQIHRGMEPNVYTRCALLDMYAKCGRLKEARRVFDEMPVRDLVSWGAIICGTMQSGDWMEALSLFRRMRWEGFRLDSMIVAMVIPACGKLGTLELGMGLQCCSVKSGFVNDLYVSNALIDMYAKCGHTHVAQFIFRNMECKDVVSWSSLIAGYSQNCEHNKCVGLFMEMVENGTSPSSVTLASVLPSLAELKLMKQAKEIHSYAIRHGFNLDTFVASALLDLYCKCQSIKEAEYIFKLMFHRDIAIANSMITGYAFSGDMESALRTLQRTRKIGLRPNSVTIVTVLPLCNQFTMLNQGKELHGYVLRGALDSEISVNNSLTDMYCKCGYLEHGKRVFEHMVTRDIITYNTIIGAFGMHGLGDQTILFFELMKEERIHPDRVTFIALLSACSHAGLLEKGLSLYNSMKKDYGIVPDMEHYSCMVDLYGRAGYLDDAWDFIKKMPVEPGIDVLGSLLGACRVHQRIDLAELISNLMFEKKIKDPGYHILMSNMYADAKRWEDVKKVRAVVKEKGLMKKPGISWIQVGCHVHSFLARDRSHSEFDKIYQIMVVLILDIKDKGYVCGLNYLYNLGGEADEAMRKL